MNNRLSFYPPRARWYSRAVFTPGEWLRRQLHLDKFRLAGRISPLDFLLSIGLPSFSFRALGRPVLGRFFLGAYILAALTFFAALGYFAGNIAYGILISIHATSIVFLEGLWLSGYRLRTRVIAAILTLVAVWALIYAPVTRYLQHHWFMPLRVGDHVVV